MFSVLAASGVNAQHSGAGCVVEQAAEAALDRQIRSIEAAQTDVASFFRGNNSCINSNLLNVIDFSTAIPDLAGLVSSLGQDAVNNMLNNAVQQACEIANEQISGVTGELNTTLSAWDSGLDDQIRGIISDGQIRIGQ
ncbi:hypothetical protein [uncultured Tateyamaria sp.]|uniref:hypothetical protein n=1 Tax=uncultured Tateyamaria sp. TaxID=455651 RepID=UPI0026345AE0|nr:hypothetical protein [uncultured Tateyamaria sp.]